MNLRRSLSKNEITGLFLKTVLILLTFHVMAVIVMLTLENKTVLKYMSIFYFDTERNLPSTYSALAIAFCAYLLWEISSLKTEIFNKRSKYWKFISVTFLFLAIDEYTSIHEHAGHIVKLFSDKVFPFHGWYIPLLAALGLISIFFMKFYFQLPKTTRLNFLYSGVIFITGAVGFDILSAIVLENYEDGLNKSIIIYTCVTIEELLEMIGIIFFMNTLLGYLINDLKKIKIKVKVKDKKPETTLV